MAQLFLTYRTKCECEVRFIISSILSTMEGEHSQQDKHQARGNRQKAEADQSRGWRSHVPNSRFIYLRSYVLYCRILLHLVPCAFKNGKSDWNPATIHILPQLTTQSCQQQSDWCWTQLIWSENKRLGSILTGILSSFGRSLHLGGQFLNDGTFLHLSPCSIKAIHHILVPLNVLELPNWMVW